MAAPKQNRFAAKKKTANSHLHIRVNESDQEHWQEVAKKAGASSYAQWVVDALTRQAKKDAG